MKSETVVSTTTQKPAKKTATRKSASPATKSKTSTEKKAASAAKAAPAQESATVPSGKVPEPTVVDAPKAVIVGPMMRKKELIDQVVARSGLKKKDVKPAVEMTLAVLGEALADNRELNLPPFGKLKVRREKHLANGRIVVAKIRQSEPPRPEEEAAGASSATTSDEK